MLIRLQKQWHKISCIKEPHISSWASYLLLKNSLKVKDQRRQGPPKLRRDLTFRNRYLRKQKKLTKNLQCRYCKTNNLDPNFFNPYRKTERRKATLEHLKPISKGGKEYDEKNLGVSCHICNNLKGDMTDQEFILKLSKL